MASLRNPPVPFGVNKSSKRLASKRAAARVFGNPLRNVSENLVKLYRKNSKHKKIISPVFESLGYSKKDKKFKTWPILLKDFIYNLNDEISKVNESPGKSLKIKQETQTEKSASSKKQGRSASAKKRSKGSNQVQSESKEESKHAKGKVAHYHGCIDLNSNIKQEIPSGERGSNPSSPESPTRNVHNVSKQGIQPKSARGSKKEESKDAEMALEKEDVKNLKME